MKRSLAPILLLILLFPTFAIGETMNGLVERDGIHYKKFSDAPYTGKITGPKQGSFKSGKRHGPWVNYYGNGWLSFKGNWKNGKRVGPWISYNADGTTRSQSTGTFENGFWRVSKIESPPIC
jgi:hypothetical protein